MTIVQTYRTGGVVAKIKIEGINIFYTNMHYGFDKWMDIRILSQTGLEI